MVKSLAAIAAAALLLAGLAYMEHRCVTTEFGGFGEELQTLVEKVEEKSANGEDAKAVQTSWENRKKRLHVWIPHGDVMRLDDYMAETVRLVAQKDYELALPKLEMLLHLTACLPDTYGPALENIL